MFFFYQHFIKKLIDLKFLAVEKMYRIVQKRFRTLPSDCIFSCAQLIGARVSGGGFD